RRHIGVPEDVVVPWCPQRPREADGVDLDGRGPHREDFAPRIEYVASGIEQNGDAVVTDALRRRLGVLGPDIDEAIEGALESRAGLAAVIGAERIGEDLEARTVVRLDDGGEKARERVSA